MLISKSNADYIPNLSTLAQQKYDLVIGVGFLMADAIDTVATKFPNTKFAIIDYVAAGAEEQAHERRGPALQGAGGRLPRRLPGRACTPRTTAARRSAASAARRSRRSTTTSPASRPAPRRPNPSIKTLNGYSQDFVDQAKCKEIALNQIAKGSKVVFQVAGECGLGALDAAKEKSMQGIGVDADQAYLGPQIMTSRSKKVDVAVFNAIKAVQDGTFKGGADVIVEPQDGRRRHRQDQRGRRRSTPTRSSRSSSRSLAARSRTSRTRSEARRRPGPDPPAMDARSSCAASRSGSGASSRTTGWTSTCAQARSTRCSARTARASRR